MKQKITDRLIRKYQVATRKTEKIWDTELPGFYCRVTAGGAKTFVFDYRQGRVRKTIKIGSFPAWSSAAARTQAQKLRVAVDEGRDPSAERAADRNALLVCDLYERVSTSYSKKAPRTQADRRQMWEKQILPILGSKRIDSVTFSDIEALHRSKTDQGHPYAANRLVEVLRHAFNKANDLTLCPPSRCPAARGVGPGGHLLQPPENGR